MALRDLLRDYKFGKHDKKSGLRFEVYTMDDVLNAMRELFLKKMLPIHNNDECCNCDECQTIETHNDAIRDCVDECR